VHIKEQAINELIAVHTI